MDIFLGLFAFAFAVGILINPTLFLRWHKTPKRWMAFPYFVVIFLIAMIFVPTSNMTIAENSILHKAKPYEIVKQEDVSFPGRDRYSIFIIAPEAKTFEERGATALKAAIDYCEEEKAHFVTAFLEADKRIAYHGHPIAIAEYCPDKGGVSGREEMKHPWTIKAMKGDVDNSQLKATIIYYTNRPKFMNGYDLDSDGLRKIVRKKMGNKEFMLLSPQLIDMDITTI